MREETSMESNDFVFDGIVEMYHKCHRISLNRDRLYIDSPDWIKKATINMITGDDKCVQYALTVAFNHERFVKTRQKVSKIKSFINN